MILMFKYVFSNSRKVRYLYQSIDTDKTIFKPMHNTMWTVRCRVISAVLNNSLDIINALEHFTMASVNSSE